MSPQAWNMDYKYSWIAIKVEINYVLSFFTIQSLSTTLNMVIQSGVAKHANNRF